MNHGILSGLFGLGLLALLSFPQSVSAGAAQALELFWEGVFPALFSGLVLCRYCLPRLEFPAEGRMTRIFSALTRCPGELLGAWCTARFSGSPAGAAALDAALEGQKVDPRYAAHMTLVVSSVSPVFLTVTAAAYLRDIPGAGWILLFAHEAGLFLSYRILGRGLAVQELRPTKNASVPNFSQVLSSTLFTLGQVACLILLFGIGWEMLRGSGVLGGLSPAAQATFLGILEMSQGCRAAGLLNGGYAIALSAFCTGFSGLCILLQCLTVIRFPLHRGRYIAGKILHGILSAVIAYGLYYATSGVQTLPAAVFSSGTELIRTWEILSAELTVLGYAIWGRRRTIDPASGRPCW